MLYFLNHGHTWKEVRARKLYSKPSYESGFISEVASQNIALMFEEVTKVSQREEERRRVIDDKNKILLTVGTILLAGNAALLAQAEWRWLALIPALFIFISVFLVLVYFRIGIFSVVDLSSINWKQDDSETKKALCSQLISVSNNLDSVNAFCAGVYRAALRSMVVGLLILAPCYVFINLQHRDRDESSEAIKAHLSSRDQLPSILSDSIQVNKAASIDSAKTPRTVDTLTQPGPE